MSDKQLVQLYKKIIEPKIPNWVIFQEGTCVILYHPKGNLENEAKEVLQKYGTVTPGTSSADFQVLRLEGLPGWIISGDQPGILNFVSEDEGRGKEESEIGLIGRHKKKQDSKELKILYINKPSE